MPSKSSFPNRLISARRHRALSQEDLANRTGLKAAAISHFETATRKPSFDNLRKLADALGVTTDYLMGRTENMDGFTEASAAFRHSFEKLTDEQRDVALDMIDALAKRNKGK